MTVGDQDEEISCCLCGRPILEHEASHGLYVGDKSRHWNCHEKRREEADAAFANFGRRVEEVIKTLEKMRSRLR